MKKILTLATGFIFLFTPMAYAQEATSAAPTDALTAPASDAVPAATTTPVPETVATDTQTTDVSPVDTVAGPIDVTTAPDVQTTDTPIDDTVITQETVDSSVLENTLDPAASSTVESMPLATSTDSIADATSTPLVGADDTPAADPIDVPIKETAPDVIDTITQSDVETAVSVDQQEQVRQKQILLPEPDPSYVFEFSGKTIPTKRQSRSDPKKIETLSESVVPQIDNTKGTMSVSGTCASPYYVVLLFKNQDDYTNDPRSYILNRAYSCEHGLYSYSINDLPPSIEDGTYYLLIGEQGESGPWSPTTGLTEITINRSAQ